MGTCCTPHEVFSDAIEPFFVKEANFIQRKRFDLGRAKNFVLSLRDLGQRYMTRGCTEIVMENIVLDRALRTVYQLQADLVMVSEQSTDVLC